MAFVIVLVFALLVLIAHGVIVWLGDSYTQGGDK